MCEEGPKINDRESETVEIIDENENNNQSECELTREIIPSSVHKECSTVRNTMSIEKIGTSKHDSRLEGSRPLEEIKELSHLGEDCSKNDANIYMNQTQTQG